MTVNIVLQIYIYLSLSLSVFLSFFQEVETRQENIRKKIPENKNQQKQKQKINSELALYPLPHVLKPDKKKQQQKKTPQDFSSPIFHPVSETFRFWQIREKKKREKKSTLVYVHEQMNS